MNNRDTGLFLALILLCMGLGSALGGGLYEGIVLTPLWSGDPPASFVTIQPETGVPLQTFWIPLHGVISAALLTALALGWRRKEIRGPVVVGLAAYVIMRVWSFAYFIPEMLAFQVIPVGEPVSDELVARVHRWTTATWFRMPLDLIALIAFLVALARVRPERSGAETSA